LVYQPRPNVLDYRYFASFRNEDDSETTLIENRGQISQVLTL